MKREYTINNTRVYPMRSVVFGYVRQWESRWTSRARARREKERRRVSVSSIHRAYSLSNKIEE